MRIFSLKTMGDNNQHHAFSDEYIIAATAIALHLEDGDPQHAAYAFGLCVLDDGLKGETILQVLRENEDICSKEQYQQLTEEIRYLRMIEIQSRHDGSRFIPLSTRP